MNDYNESVPVDEDGYTHSFHSSNYLKESVLNFFSRYGFVVFHDVFNYHECLEARNGMWEIIESSCVSFDRNDPVTWDTYKSTGKYGLSSRGPSFHPCLVRNRQNETLLHILAFLIGVEKNDIMVSHDRFTIYRATKFDDPNIEGNKFITGKPNIHLDLNPWWWEESSPDVIIGAKSIGYNESQDFIKENNLVVKSMGRHVQCVLNFLDNREEDGGTLIVPGFHNNISTWNKENASIRKKLPWVTMPANIEETLLQAAQRITMREGSVLIWDQTVAHGTAPNNSTKCRMAQYVKAFSRSQTCHAMSAYDQSINMASNVDERLHRRACLLTRCLEESGALNEVTPLGRSVFGLDVL
eukprot:gene12397-16628_t